MTGYPIVDGILAAVTALLGAYGVWAGGRKALADARALKAPPPTPYEALANRVSALETSDAEKGRELSRLRQQLRRLAGVMTREVAAVVRWHDDGQHHPPPDREVTVIRAVIRELEHDPE